MRGRPTFDAYYQLLADETEKRVQAMIDVDLPMSENTARKAALPGLRHCLR